MRHTLKTPLLLLTLLPTALPAMAAEITYNVYRCLRRRWGGGFLPRALPALGRGQRPSG